MITYHLDVWILLGFVLQFVLPLAVGLVTTRLQTGNLRALLLAALSVVVAIVTAALAAHSAGTPFDLVQATIDALGGFLVSVGAHFGIWKPTGAADAALDALRKPPAPAPIAALPPFLVLPPTPAPVDPPADATPPAPPAPPAAS